MIALKTTLKKLLTDLVHQLDREHRALRAATPAPTLDTNANPVSFQQLTTTTNIETWFRFKIPRQQTGIESQFCLKISRQQQGNRITGSFQKFTTTRGSNHGFVSKDGDSIGNRSTVSFQNGTTSKGIEARFRFKRLRQQPKSNHGFVSKGHGNQGARMTVSFQLTTITKGIGARFRLKRTRPQRESNHGFVSKDND